MFPERACLADLGENDEGRRTTSASTWCTWTCTLSHTPHINQEKKRYTHSILSERLFMRCMAVDMNPVCFSMISILDKPFSHGLWPESRCELPLLQNTFSSDLSISTYLHQAAVSLMETLMAREAAMIHMVPGKDTRGGDGPARSYPLSTLTQIWLAGWCSP